MALFNHGEFVLSAGNTSPFLIDCESLTDDDLAALAEFAQTLIDPVHEVHGVPRGGLRFAEALRKHTVLQSGNEGRRILLVDDVFTTGKSLANFFDERLIEDREGPWGEWPRKYRGLVIFNRSPGSVPSLGMTSLFTMGRG